MTDNVTKLNVVPSVSAGTSGEGVFNSLVSFIKDQELLDRWDVDSVVLSHALPSTTVEGPLSKFEREAFALHHALSSAIEEEIIDIEASNADTIASIMRKERLNAMDASRRFAQERESYLTSDQLETLGALGALSTTALSLYEWSFRSRNMCFGKKLTVHTGFVAYSHG